MVQDPAKLGLLDAPRTTGVAFTIPVKNQLAVFRMVYPHGVRIGVIYDEANTGRLVQEAKTGAGVVHLAIVERAVSSEKQVPEALRSLLRGDDAVDALWVTPDPILLGDEARRYVWPRRSRRASQSTASHRLSCPRGAGQQWTGHGIHRRAARRARQSHGEPGRGGQDRDAHPKGGAGRQQKVADKLKIEIPIDALKAANKVF
jgi:hypothetical protein